MSPVCLPARLRRCCAEGFGAFACKVGLSQPPALFVSPATPLCCCRWLHGLQAQLIDGVLFLDVRFMVAGLGRRMRRHLRCRRLQHRLHHCFPDATQQQLARDPCPICLSRMKASLPFSRSFWWYRSCCCCCSSLPTVPPSSLPRPLPHCLPLLQAGKQLPKHTCLAEVLCSSPAAAQALRTPPGHVAAWLEAVQQRLPGADLGAMLVSLPSMVTGDPTTTSLATIGWVEESLRPNDLAAFF